ncbi:DUF4365 domain-containing protein [Pseudomonas protegens]|uniref:DUF4365 domain-containing protein n=1 Tax=Pseudomonas protegens TaxID=380021 RepID=UPI00226466A4|nr:DUF4365 domain-containing protein [Pseudomonas protegens]
MELIPPSKNSNRLLPQRSESHIADEKAQQILTASVPSNSILRPLSGWDYGIDYYMELTNEAQQLTGAMGSIQLKGRSNVNWNNEGQTTIHGIKISTSNYWNEIPHPVFLVLADLDLRKAFYLPVKSYIRQNYETFNKQNTFSYRISSERLLSADNPENFLHAFKIEQALNKIDDLITSAPTFFHDLYKFYHDWHGRDFHMSVDERWRIEKLAYFVGKFANYSTAFKVPFEYSSTDSDMLAEWSIEASEMLELNFTDFLNRMDNSYERLIQAIKHRVTIYEPQYWESTSLTIPPAIENLTPELLSIRSRRAFGLKW